MSKIFSRDFRVRFSELDANGSVAPASYLRYLVETAYDWGQSLGLTSEFEQSQGIFWLIRETEIQLYRPLYHNDRIRFTIWMVNWQKVRGARCFEITANGSDQVIARGTQQIVCMDVRTGRPTTPPEDIIEHFRLESPRVFPSDRFPKVNAPQDTFVTSRAVEWGALDALAHVNNANYVTYAEEAAAQDFAARGWPPAKLAENQLTVAIRRLHIQYLSPVIWGETLQISTHQLNFNETGGSRYIGMTRSDGGTLVCECLLDWELIHSVSGAPQKLPLELSRQ